MTGRRHRAALAVATLTAAVAASLVLAGCGSPSYRYATNTHDGVFFKVPATWARVDQGELDRLATTGLDAQAAAALEASSWSVAFDAQSPPSAQHVVAADLGRPVAYARVLQVPAASRGGVTVAALRDIFVPVTKSARTQAVSSGTALGPFSMLSTNSAAPDGLTGVHQVFSYGTGAARQVFDQTSWTNRDHSRIYLLLVRCNDTCYAQRHAELSSVVQSFTVDKNGTS